jgi:uncharacterized protein YjbI with pentapeptide repeats
MFEPQRAPVRPRVYPARVGETLLLEEELRQRIESGEAGDVLVLGPPGSGKTTALRHLAAVFTSDDRVRFLDEPARTDPQIGLPGHLVVYAATAEHPRAAHLARYRLASWTDDDLIEFLLATHKSRCASVMSRIQTVDRVLLQGIPDLWQIALEGLAADESLADARSALHRHLEAHLRDTDLLERARSACLNALARQEPVTLDKLAKPGFERGLLRVLRHEAVRLLLAAERVAADLHGDADADFLARRLPRELVEAAAALIANDRPAQEHLQHLLAGPDWSHSMAASLLHALDRRWVPMMTSTPMLAGAYLDGALWPGVQLAHARLMETDLSGANLRGADLSHADASKADLSHAELNGASLTGLKVQGANLAHADLSRVQAMGAQFHGADLERAVLEDAFLSMAVFGDANLEGAVFCGANLTGAVLVKARIKGADFTGADLRHAQLTDLGLREARFAGADLGEAWLSQCDLEYMDLLGVGFGRANLTKALLTGTVTRDANFQGACLREAGLAEIDWEGADLRNADLRGATFHLGTSRSGLVFSPIACEGSRTGFYTDDYNEQTHKAPEEIRKANLCGADLRGARLDKVDFYLVDLRGARFDPEHEAHLRRSGAILEARVE